MSDAPVEDLPIMLMLFLFFFFFSSEPFFLMFKDMTSVLETDLQVLERICSLFSASTSPPRMAQALMQVCPLPHQIFCPVLNTHPTCVIFIVLLYTLYIAHSEVVFTVYSSMCCNPCRDLDNHPPWYHDTEQVCHLKNLLPATHW